MSSERAYRPVYPRVPSAGLVKDFRRHVAATGQPETFPTISMSKPPADGDIVVLLRDLDIDIAKRPDRSAVPCPICAGAGEKFYRRGLLIWCGASKAIYFIGPDCGQRLYSDGRLTVAINQHRRTAQQNANMETLVREASRIPLLLAWIAENLPRAVATDRLHASFARDAPKLRSALRRVYKQRNSNTAFLQGRWTGGQDMLNAEADLKRIENAFTGPISEEVFALADGVVNERLETIRKAYAKLKQAAKNNKAASDFMADHNIALLTTMSRSEHAPVNYRLTRTAAAVRLQTDHESWSGTGSIQLTTPLPY